MPYLLDTCLVSELRKPGINPGVSAWISSIDANEAFLSVLTIGEIRSGIELHRLKNPTGASNLDRWLPGLETHYAERVLRRPLGPTLPSAAATGERRLDCGNSHRTPAHGCHPQYRRFPKIRCQHSQSL